jgi:hypothetical protein
MTSTSAPAPVFTGAGLADIFARLVPFTFDSGMDVDMRADFPEHGNTVVFGVACTPSTRGGQDTGPFLAAVHSSSETVAGLLIAAQERTALTGRPETVPLDCLDTDPTWPVLKLAVERYTAAEGA